MKVLEPSPAQFGLALQHVLFRGRQHAVEPPQHGQGEDDVLVLAALEGIPDQVGDAPDEADDLAVVHLNCSLNLTP